MNFWEKKSGIRESDDKKFGMRDSREKGAGMRDQDPPFQTLFSLSFFCENEFETFKNRNQTVWKVLNQRQI